MLTSDIDGTTRLFAILGDPIHMVRSPPVFNALFARRGLNAVMVAVRVRAGDLPQVWTGLKSMANLEGVIFTMPHKPAGARLVDRVGSTGGLVGAVNAARREPDGAWLGDMFDGAGCVRGLAAQGHEVGGRTVMLVGAGGAGAAIAAALAAAGARRIVIHDIDAAKRDHVVENTAAAFPGVTVVAGSVGDGVFDLAINATPLGIKPGDPLPFDPQALPASTLIVDIIPSPEITALLERARATGHRVHPSGHMILGQVDHIADFFLFV